MKFCMSKDKEQQCEMQQLWNNSRVTGEKTGFIIVTILKHIRLFTIQTPIILSVIIKNRHL